MAQDAFLTGCHPHIVGENGQIDLGQCQALADEMAELREMGVILTLVGSYSVGRYRYSNLRDAMAQARLACATGAK